MTAGVAVLAAVSSLSGLVLQQRIASRTARQSENDHLNRRYHEAVKQLGYSDKA